MTGVRISSTEIAIPARAGLVWSVLTDLDSYPAWNPYIRKAAGRLREGARWRLERTLNGRAYRTRQVTVTGWEPGRRLAWRGGLTMPPLLVGEHEVRILETADGVRLVQAVAVAGLLAPALVPWLRTRLHARFAAMNEALRDEVLRRLAESA